MSHEIFSSPKYRKALKCLNTFSWSWSESQNSSSLSQTSNPGRELWNLHDVLRWMVQQWGYFSPCSPITNTALHVRGSANLWQSAWLSPQFCYVCTFGVFMWMKFHHTDCWFVPSSVHPTANDEFHSLYNSWFMDESVYLSGRTHEEQINTITVAHLWWHSMISSTSNISKSFRFLRLKWISPSPEDVQFTMDW